VVDVESDTHFIYSSTLVEYFKRDDNRRIEYPFTDEERQVTAIVDAQGISKVQSLPYLAGKRNRLHIVTSRYFRPAYRDDNLILIGSPNANTQTERALRDYNSPFRFNDDVSAVIEVPGSPDGRWPQNRAALEERDQLPEVAAD